MKPMRRASHHGIVADAKVEVLVSSTGPITQKRVAPLADDTERNEQLAAAIKQRIESRLPGRVRKLSVRAEENRIIIEGQCATYYTKQLAQHAAIGVLEEEHQLENAIVVMVGQ